LFGRPDIVDELECAIRRMRMKQTRSFAVIPVALLVFLGVTSCATTFRPEPTSEDDSLIVGAYSFDGWGDLADGLGASLTLGNVRLEAERENAAEGEAEVIEINRRADGIVGLAGAATGTYRLVSLEVDVVYQSQVVGGGALVFSEDLFFDVRAGSISNLGRLIVSFTQDDEMEVNYEFTGEYVSVRETFESRYDSSLWLNFEWVSQDMR
jgi:hypothetical protein